MLDSFTGGRQNTKTSYAINAGPLVPLGQKAWRFFVARFVRQVVVDLAGRVKPSSKRCSLRTKQRALSKVSVALNDPEIPFEGVRQARPRI